MALERYLLVVVLLNGHVVKLMSSAFVYTYRSMLLPSFLIKASYRNS